MFLQNYFYKKDRMRYLHANVTIAVARDLLQFKSSCLQSDIRCEYVVIRCCVKSVIWHQAIFKSKCFFRILLALFQIWFYKICCEFLKIVTGMGVGSGGQGKPCPSEFSYKVGYRYTVVDRGFFCYFLVFLQLLLLQKKA